MRTNLEIEEKENDQEGVTVVLGVYKRPHTLIPMINAFENQTIKPKEIWIVQDGNFFDIPKEIKDKYNVFQSSKNMGVWMRFTLALLAKTKYICMQDDDSIPGSKRLENCMNESKKKRGLYGTIGCIMGVTKRGGAKNRGAPETWVENYYSHIRAGWALQNEETVEVDLIGHSWFFERSVLSEYFKHPLLPQFWMCGEDMELGFAHQRLGLGIYVAPHPMADSEMWGSLKGWELGTKQSSRSVHQGGDNDCYDTYWKYIRQRGFVALADKKQNNTWVEEVARRIHNKQITPMQLYKR